MRLDAKHDAEVAKRKGLAIRTIAAVIWLGLCFALAYYISKWLFETGAVSPNFFYNKLLIPRTISEEIILIGFMVLIVIIMQFFVLVGFAWASPLGRKRPGKPTAYSQDPEPSSSHYDYR